MDAENTWPAIMSSSGSSLTSYPYIMATDWTALKYTSMLRAKLVGIPQKPTAPVAPPSTAAAPMC